ncbi:hypothetical protein GY45DRAFT_1370380 [Cubamyces sp. BRFM 1775]|nr:hypothetical protein GY45DRAFT_1370380 [Cubamyces sp. BRFM 1775]
MVARKATNMDRVCHQLRRHGSGSFARLDFVNQGKRESPLQDKRALGQVGWHYEEALNTLVEIRASRDQLDSEDDAFIVGKFYRIMMGRLKRVPKTKVWDMYFSVQKEARELREDYEVFKDVHGQTMPRTGAASSQGGSFAAPASAGNLGRTASFAPTEPEALENPEGPFSGGSALVRQGSLREQLERARSGASMNAGSSMMANNAFNASGSTGAPIFPQTPRRVDNPGQSYLTPPSTITPVARHRSQATFAPQETHASGRAAPAPAALSSAGGADITAEMSDGAVSAGSATAMSPAEGGNVYDELIRNVERAREQANRERCDLERQLQEALARSAFDAERDAERRIGELQRELAACEERCAALDRELAAKTAELSAAHAQTAALSEERDCFQRKHFAATVALKGSQMQVEKRDKEARSMMQRIAHVFGISGWMP